MKRILSSINGNLSINNPNNSDFQKNKSDKIKEKITQRQDNDKLRHKKESEEFHSKLKSIRPSTARNVNKIG